MLWKKRNKTKFEWMELYILFKNGETFKLRVRFNERHREVVNDVAEWFTKRKSETHFLRITETDNVEVVAFSRSEICMVTTRRLNTLEYV